MAAAPLPRLAITTGEPAGIGPEISLAALADASFRARFRGILIGDGRMLAARARATGVALPLVAYQPDVPPPTGAIEVLDVPLAVASVAGRLDTANAHAVLEMLSIAIDGASRKVFDAVVTAPVQKSVINQAGVAFSGHTEFFAERTHTARVVMMLAGGKMRVALATTHLPLAAVAGAINQADLEATLRILHTDLTRWFGVERPRILVAGLNPHAGESGVLGREEIDIIEPVLNRLRQEGLDLIGPLPADTLFQPSRLAEVDAVLAMYHDQGLPVLKYASFGSGVNITLGLPVIRTSVDHGTALDLAGTGRADAGSMRAAIECALEMHAAQRARMKASS
jgi:4-hydroxythreonine-4-phosphate dehydrogenase